MSNWIKKSLVVALVIAGLGVGGVFLKSQRQSVKIRVTPDVEIELPDTEPWQENMARGQLHDLFQNCKLYWDMEGKNKSCSIEKVTQKPYYFSQTPIDRTKEEGLAPVTLISGNRSDFRAQASHEGSPVIWFINQEGKFNCSLGSKRACWDITHLTREEILKEVREYVGDVPDDTDYIDFSTYPPVAGKYGK